MKNATAIEAVRSFVEAINRQSLGELSERMTEDHTFIDSLGRKVSGRENMLAGWKGYWTLFPDYTMDCPSPFLPGPEMPC